MQRIVLLLLLLGLFTESASAQLIRRQLQRIPGFPGGQAYRVGSALQRERIIQGDGRAVERVMNIVGLFTGANTELKPVIVISFASFDEFRRIIQIVAQQIRLDKGSTDEPVLLNMALNLYERIVGQGFDTSQPLGIVLQTDGVFFYPILFTPLNLDSNIGRSLQNQYAECLPDGRTVIRQEFFRWSLGRLYVQEHNGWVFIAPESLLNSLPDTPTVLLQGLDQTALIAARFDLQNLPPLTTRAVLSLGEMKAVAEAESEIDKAVARLNIGYIRSLAEQADFLEYTFSYDDKQNDYVFTQREIVKPDTERARLLQERRHETSPLHGFYHPDGAVLASHFVMSLTQTQRTQLEIILDESVGKHLADHIADTPNDVFTDAQKIEMLFRRIGVTYYSALIGAVRSGKFDGASTWSREHGILAAYNIVDGEQFQESFDAIFAEVQEQFPDIYEKNVQKDYAESEGFRLTSVVFRPGDFVRNPFIRSLTPPNLAAREIRLILGVREDAVCFAMGQGIQPEKVLVEAIGEMKEFQPVSDMFFVYSAHELGQAFASAGRPERLVRLKLAAADTNPLARAYAISEFTDTARMITIRVSGLLTPSLWRMREAMR
jgi:hypothetical protein